MKRALIVRSEKCTGCHACEMVCSLMHDGECSIELSRIGVMKTNGGGTFENTPIVCRQCTDPTCADVCETDAIQRDEKTGALLIDESLCVGCETCVGACPYGGVLYHYIKECAMKCDLCGGDPECIKSCVYGALQFMPVDDQERIKRM